MKTIPLFLAVLVLMIRPAFAGEPLRIGDFYTMVLSTPQETGFLDLVIKEALARVEKEVVFVQLPPARSIILANDGALDGDISRVSDIHEITGNRFPNIVKVPEKLFDAYYVAFSKDVDIEIEGWESLKPYTVGIVTGFKIMEENTKEVKNLTKVENPRLLFTLLKKNRADMIIYDRYIGYGILKLMGMKGVKALDPPLATREFFLYLNKKHLKLIPKIAEAMAEMKKDGTYQDMFNKTIGLLVREVDGWSK
ncbi:MAG: transporter substrate-binding domain-containing protein [Desulfatiglans sp.]|jgi:polar amino acid transport system substrate-binding protein|nr:transporter substrate-binding domain-containing protein [Desulfatiglans sp.]